MSSSIQEAAVLANLTSHQLAALSDVPILPPPPGLEPNLHNAEHNGSPFFIVTSVLLFLTTILMINRAYAKTYIVRKYTWDDFIGLMAVIFTIAIYVACLWGTTRGNIWAHRWDLSVARVASKDFRIPIWFFASFNNIAIGTIRVTFFITYLNIFGTLRWLRISAYIGGTFTALYHIAIAVVVFVLTTPAPGHTWFSAMTTSGYQRFLKIILPNHVVRFAIDMYILVLPLIAISRTQLPTKKKISVCLIFLTGLTACIASALTVYYVDLLVKTSDVTGALMPVCTVILAEMFLGIIVLCIPAAARSCRHHSDSYHHLMSAIGSKITRQGSTSTALAPVTSNGPFLDLDGKENTWGNPFAHLEGPRTVIRCGTSHDVDEDGVRLTFEMKTTVQEKVARSTDFGGRN